MGSDSKTCSSCSKSNPPDAKFCAYCGTPLLSLLPAQTTLHIQSPTLESTLGDSLSQLTGQSLDALVLKILGHEKPVVVKVTSSIVLGRFSPGETAPTVDLTPYHGGLMGVSRQHAIIKRDASGYSIQDIGSTNGTWLNEEKLLPYKSYPLRSGDLIRLGQLGINAHFGTEKASPANKPTGPALMERKTNNHLKTGAPLGNPESTIIAYLKAVTEIQELFNQKLGTKSQGIYMQAISFNDTQSTLDLHLSGAPQAIEFIKTQVARWQETNADVLKQFYPKTSELEQNPLSGENGKIDQPGQQLADAELALAQALLETVAPQQSGEERKPYLEKLLPHVHTIIGLPLRISNR